MSARGYELDEAVRKVAADLRLLDLKQARVRYGLGAGSGGDVGGGTPAEPRVTGIQGVPVDADAATPDDRDALIYETGTGWIADHVQAEDVDYDPTASGSPETDVQAELDRLEAAIAPVSLDDLTDVVITSPALYERLRFDGTNWRNSNRIWRPLLAGDGTIVVAGDGQAIMSEGPP